MKLLFPILLGILVLATHAKGQSFNHSLMNFSDVNAIVVQTPICPPEDIDRKIENAVIIDKFDKEITISVISYSFLEELFEEMAQNSTIPFDYPKNGCYARAHEMVQLLEKKKVIAGKAFIEGDLKVPSTHTPEGYVKWDYHVAPLVLVKTEDGNIPYVIDPSIFDRPVTLKYWQDYQLKHNVVKKMTSRKLTQTYETNRFPLFPNDERKTAYDPSQLKSSRHYLKQFTFHLIEEENLDPKTKQAEKIYRSKRKPKDD